MGTAIINCKCDHEYQDRMYGRKRRVGNMTRTEGEARCTVCEATARYKKEIPRKKKGKK